MTCKTGFTSPVSRCSATEWLRVVIEGQVQLYTIQGDVYYVDSCRSWCFNELAHTLRQTLPNVRTIGQLCTLGATHSFNLSLLNNRRPKRWFKRCLPGDNANPAAGDDFEMCCQCFIPGCGAVVNTQCCGGLSTLTVLRLCGPPRGI